MNFSFISNFNKKRTKKRWAAIEILYEEYQGQRGQPMEWFEDFLKISADEQTASQTGPKDDSYRRRRNNNRNGKKWQKFLKEWMEEWSEWIKTAKEKHDYSDEDIYQEGLSIYIKEVLLKDNEALKKIARNQMLMGTKSRAPEFAGRNTKNIGIMSHEGLEEEKCREDAGCFTRMKNRLFNAIAPPLYDYGYGGKKKTRKRKKNKRKTKRKKTKKKRKKKRKSRKRKKKRKKRKSKKRN